MKKQILVFLLMVLGGYTLAQGNFGEIVGKVFEKSETEEPAYGAVVWVMLGESKMPGRVDMEGRFRIPSVPSGRYLLQAIYMGDTLQNPFYVSVNTDGITNVGRIDILEHVQIGDETVVFGTRDPLVNFGDVGQKRISAQDIMLSPVRNDPGLLVVSRNSEIKMNNNGELMIRGSRAGDMVYFVDGIKTNGIKAIPSVAIGGMTVYSTAIPAKYGDTTGGVIIMETKSYNDLLIERKMGLR